MKNNYTRDADKTGAVKLDKCRANNYLLNKKYKRVERPTTNIQDYILFALPSVTEFAPAET
jgi:hypothetical protein